MLKHLLLPLLLLSFSILNAQNVYYGAQTLKNLKQFGIEVRVHTTPELEKYGGEYRKVIVDRLERRRFLIHKSSSVILKLFVTAIKGSDNSLITHLSLQLHQGAYLGFNNKQVDAATWDAWKMGQFSEMELLKEVDDLARLFVNDYLTSN